MFVWNQPITAMDKSQLIKLYTNRLVRALVPAEFGPEFIQSVSHELLVVLSRTESTNDQSQKQYEINQATARFKTHFLTNGFRDEWAAFQRILDSLAQVKTLDQIHSYLVFLSVLKDGPAQPSPVPGHSRANLSPHSDFHSTSPAIPSSRPYTRTNRDFSSGNMGAGVEYPHSSPYKDTPLIPLDQVIKPYYESMNEDLILTYLSYTLLGLDSKLLAFDSDKQIELPSNVNNSYSGILFDILECALLYKRLHNFTQHNKGKLSSPIQTAFLTVLESQLLAYIDHINELFNTQPASLISVYNRIYDWILNLRLLYSLVTQVLEVNGYDFLSKVYELTKFGDVSIKKLALQIFQSISTPYYQIIEHWIINGELIDESDEFFVKFDFEKNEFNDIILFLPERIPFFIDKVLSFKILQIGKMLIYLNKYCKELLWVNQYSNKYSHILFQLNHGVQSMNTVAFNELINEQYEKILNYFTNIIHGPKNEMAQHLNNFKKIYFIQKNDFIDSIISSGAEIFNEPSTTISSNYLSKILNESINNSSLKYNKFSKRLDARVLDPIHGNIGWEVFTLEYRIDDLPINSLFENHMVQYLKMFNFLWRLRHLQYLLNEHSLDCVSLRKNELKRIHLKYLKVKRTARLSIRDKKIVWLIKSFNTINMIRFNLIKFMNSLVQYLSFDVIEDAYHTLITKKLFKSNEVYTNEENEGFKNRLLQLLNAFNPSFIQSIKGSPQTSGSEQRVLHNVNELTFDEIIKMHEAYLSKIVNSKLINEDSLGKTTKTSYIEQVYKLLELVFRFYKSAEEYNHLVVNYVLILNIEASQAENEIDADMVEIDALQDTEDKLQAITDRIYRHIYQQFQEGLANFVRDLKVDYELKPMASMFV
ncbi:spindle pole body component [Suhomyces tanzawaensis NRRL Y-17324]|uniref:Spindle pole body component n=1 Tax=Suhomyces tanzawaensis NRRL Y-17324 TaxID=984487 RepID=A0A1E4SRR3_9ASCO|nr:spindle pole body component [Suhomyces tanzawaensis NRRL Y-17324]ODV82203.1 spindle pole body component [Suhomyces tanzawaensis NRRL Y-17324]